MDTFITRDGWRLRYLDEGKREGLAVLFMPGAQGEHSIYDMQIPVLADAGYRAVRVDRQGRGESESGKYRYTGGGESQDTWDLLTSLGIQKAVLVGRSSGAGVIRRMYFDASERVVGLVCVDSSSFGKLYDPTPEDLRTDHPLDWGLDSRFDAETTALYHKNKAVLQTIGRLWDYPSDFNTQQCFEWFHERVGIGANYESMPPDPRWKGAGVTCPEGKWCKVPLLLFASGMGRMGPESAEALELKARLPGEDVTLVLIKNVGHWINVERSEEFNRHLLAFLVRIKQNRGG